MGGSKLDAALALDFFVQRNAYVDFKIRNMLGNGNDIWWDSLKSTKNAGTVLDTMRFGSLSWT